ncbi:esterase/lipase family protein [Rhabdothermincola sp.]|uniref:esterase/lipase family protein n=1 Tax=Rhabdothermincola sp. TaxID=2820405 RepID=UPI002FE2FE6B
MGALQRAVEPVGAVLHAARRPASYAGQLREALSTVITAGMWPLGFTSSDLADVGRLEALPSTVETPVLLVHGYGANKSNWLFLRRYLEQAGFARVHAFDYNPLAADIPQLAQRCAERAEQLRGRLGVERIHIVGHSLGGVIARYAVQVLGLKGVAVCITIASPHGGVRLARYGSPLAALSPLASGLQLRPDSEVMTLLRYSARPLPTRFVAYYSNLDMIVPARRAMILEPELRATNILVKDHGHLSIVLSRRLAQSVVDQLGAAEGLPGYGSPVVGLPEPAQGCHPVAGSAVSRSTRATG